MGYTGLCLLTVLAHGVDGAAVYPDKTWATREPSAAGLDRGKLDAFRDFVGGRGCIVRHGFMVYSWGDPSECGDVASAAKPWYSYFLLRAIENRQIRDVDERLVALESRLFGLNAELGYKDREITWRHLATQTSCYGVTERPGAAFDYNDWQMALFIDTLFGHIYGATWESVDRDVLHPLLTDVMQCEDNPTLRAFGQDDRPGRLGVSPRDFARFGLLFLREGRWRDRELLSPEHARMLVSSPLPGNFPRTTGLAAEMIPKQRTLGSRVVPDDQCDHIGSYSWLWWTNGVDRAGARHWPAAPVDTYGAFGHGGIRAMVVIPSLDLIVSWNDARIESREAENTALGLLVAASPREPRTRVSLSAGQWRINDAVTYPRARTEGLLLNVRMVNAVFEDRNRADFDPEANTDKFIAAIPDYVAHGVRVVTLNLQGGFPGYEGALNSAFEPDGALRDEYLARVQKAIEACDRNGAAVILGCFYQRQDQVLRDETAVRTAVANVVRWLAARGFTNVLLEVANEFGHGGFDHQLLRSDGGQVELIALARQTAAESGYELLISTSSLGDARMADAVAEASDFLLLHLNGVPVEAIPERLAALKRFGKPIVVNEDDKVGEEAARAAEACIAHGASWGYMGFDVNQRFPFTFGGAADDPVVYAVLKQQATPPQ